MANCRPGSGVTSIASSNALAEARAVLRPPPGRLAPTHRPAPRQRPADLAGSVMAAVGRVRGAPPPNRVPIRGTDVPGVDRLGRRRRRAGGRRPGNVHSVFVRPRQRSAVAKKGKDERQDEPGRGQARQANAPDETARERRAATARRRPDAARPRAVPKHPEPTHADRQDPSRAAARSRLRRRQHGAVQQGRARRVRAARRS